MLFLWTAVIPSTPLVMLTGTPIFLASAAALLACAVALWLVRERPATLPDSVPFDAEHRLAA